MDATAAREKEATESTADAVIYGLPAAGSLRQ